MSLKMLSSVAGVLVFMFALTLNVNAQFNNQVSETWGKQNSSVGGTLIQRLVQRQRDKSSKTTPKNSAVVKFSPVGDSGVRQALADALGQNAEQKTALAEAFEQIKQGYEAEVAKEGKSNNLAAAMTFFIASNVMTYGQTEPPSDEETEKLFVSLQEVMSTIPAFAEMTNEEKQKMHDWLVYMGGFAMTNYMDAKQSGDKEALANIKSFADYSIRLVLGVEASKLNFSANGLNIQNNASVSNTTTNTQSVNNEVVGTWTRISSSPMSLAGTIKATQEIMVNQGYFKSRYIFNADGTYTYKAESWGGYSRSNEYWIFEESGTFSVNGDSLTIAPKTSKATLKNREGVVQKSQNTPLENATYKWKTHYFEGINQMNLVLEPSKPTTRDGVVGGSSLFPNAYLYGQGDKIEWRF